MEATPRSVQAQDGALAHGPSAQAGNEEAQTAHPRRARNPHCARLVEVARRIVERLPDQDLKGAFLFGSSAWGDADAASDLDIMVLLDRPPGYREVTRRRAADLLGLSAPLPDGPRFIDLDRFSAAAFAESAARGGPAYRLAHSVILRDADGFLARLRASATADLASDDKRAARFRQRHGAATAARDAASEALAAGDPPLAVLHSRLAVQEAASALIELTGDRVSVTHLVESATAALRSLGRAALEAPFLGALALDGPPDALRSGIARSLRAYRAFADALKRWMDDPSIAGRLSIPEFHAALRDEPALLAEWVEALRLESATDALRAADELAGELLAAGDGALGAPADSHAYATTTEKTLGKT